MGSLSRKLEQHLLYEPAKIGNSFVFRLIQQLSIYLVTLLKADLRRLCFAHLHSRSDRLLLLLGRGSRCREHLQVVAAGKQLSNRHTSQHTNRVRKAPPEINTHAELLN